MISILFILLALTKSFHIFNKPIVTSQMWKIVNDKNTKIISRKSGKIFDNQNIKDFHELYESDRLIILTPGGLNGFYMLGTVKYIAQNYKLDRYIYSGASAGAWNALLMSFKYDKVSVIENILLDKSVFNNVNTLPTTQHSIKKHLLFNYEASQFNFSKLFIGVTQYKDCKFHTNIYTDFIDLEDAIDCCIASSHIPFITNGFIQRYLNTLSFDGGFSVNPYIKKDAFITIKPDIWNKNKNIILRPKNINVTELYENGYYDSAEHADELDDKFNF